MVCVEQHFIQASPIKYLATFLRAEAVRIRRVSLSGRHSQFPIRLVERNCSFELARRIQDTNFTSPEARARFGIVDCLTLLGKHGLNAGSLENFPAPTVRSDFNQCHRDGQRLASSFG